MERIDDFLPVQLFAERISNCQKKDIQAIKYQKQSGMRTIFRQLNILNPK